MGGGSTAARLAAYPGVDEVISTAGGWVPTRCKLSTGSATYLRGHCCYRDTGSPTRHLPD
jgi:hypothetical protein